MIVRTVLGDISPVDLGVTYSHEHLIIDSRLVEKELPDIYLPSIEDGVTEVSACKAVGVETMVDAMPTGSGRNLRKLAEISRRTDVNVIASTGMHTGKYYEGVDWVDDSPEDLALRFIPEILEGVDEIKCGVMKVATSASSWKAREEALFLAAGLVHISTGIPILTHCEDGLGGVKQIEMLVGAGVEPDQILLSHTDKVLDRGYHRAMLESGASVEYDQSLRQHLNGSVDTATLIVDLWELGFGPQLLLGTDGARRSLWSTFGGAPGLAWLKSGYPEILLDYGLGESEVETMFVTNPARVLAFNPPR